MESVVKTDSKGRKKVLDACTEPCAIEKGMRLIGGKWKGSIIYHLKDEPVRFNDLTRMLGGASKKMVDQRLKELRRGRRVPYPAARVQIAVRRRRARVLVAARHALVSRHLREMTMSPRAPRFAPTSGS